MDIQIERANKLADLTLEMFELCTFKFEKIAKSLDLSISEFKTLQSFGDDILISPGELAKRMDLSNSRLTKIIDNLVEKDIVDRGLSLKDRRVMEVMLTEKGKILVENLKHRYTASHLEIVNHLPEDSIDSVIYAMRKLISATKEWDKKIV
jgi:DNA-binding MarR family transcriptional regulator